MTISAPDIRHAIRSLWRAPGFSAVALFTIALGVAANTAIFSMVQGVLLRRLPYASGERLVHITQPSKLRADVRMSIPEIADLREQTHSFDAIVEYHSMSFQLYGLGEPQRLQTGVVSDNFFQVLGVRPIRGRLFSPGEEAVGAPPVVLLSYEYWMNALKGDTSVIGAKFTMNDRVHTVVGILPPLPAYPGTNDIWVPAGACPFRSAPAAMASRTARLPTVIARLKPGVSLAQATGELRVVSQRLHTAYPAAYPESDALRIDSAPVREEMIAGSRSLVLILFSTAFFLMVVAAANFAGLTVARQLRRGREIALREALGASRMRIFSQLAVESLILSMVGGVLGTGLAFSGLGLLRSFATRVTPRAGEIRIDATVLAFAILTCVIVGLAAAAAPLIRWPNRALLADRLRQGNSGAMQGKAEVRLRRAFVLVQVAMAFVLLVGAGLVGRSLWRLQHVDAGFDARNVMTARVILNFSKYTTTASARNFADELLQRMENTPGMARSAIANNFPLNNRVSATQRFVIEGRDSAQSAGSPQAEFSSVSPKYFDVIGVSLKRGRVFTAADRDTLSVSLIISQHLATAYWGSRDPVGSRISVDGGKTWNPIIGVVGDVHQTGLDQDVADEVYLPAASSPPGGLRVLVRFTGNGAPIATQIRNIVHDIDPQQAIDGMQTLEDVRGGRLAEPRLTAVLLATFAIVALILSATGLAGVIGYAVTQRIPEIAIRRALGASAAAVVRLVAQDGVVMLVLGLAAGLVTARTLSRFVRALLFGIGANDLTTYLAVTAILLVTAAIACLGPARRAMSADPARVLRGG